ncbi:FAD-dependent oxidoreductase [Streptomyces chrestomyceticus]|uniref:FAD-dependent oxidoreductase n=2 Tax=Streptomyces chrestomyceticus TaxID=68185 RepID=UPI00067B3D51
MALAHGLKRAGISFAAYEREETRSSGLHGYRVGINPDGSRALEYRGSETQPHPRPRRQRRPRQQGEVREPDAPPAELPTGIEDEVHFGKTFTHYEKESDGRVTAYFEDSTSATGDLLVAADGANSRMGQKYLPHSRVQDAIMISITARVPITPESKALSPSEVFQGIGLVVAPKGCSCILHTMEFGRDRAGRIKNGIDGNDGF